MRKTTIATKKKAAAKRARQSDATVKATQRAIKDASKTLAKRVRL